MSSRCCLFCGGSLTGKLRAKEHIIARWLLDHLGVMTDEIDFVHRDGAWVELETRPLVLDRYVSGHVCKICNEGWMSRLEQGVMPILPDLIKGQRVVWDLDDEDEISTLARWITKSAYCVDNASLRRSPLVPPAHARTLMNHSQGLPPGVSVIGAFNPFYIPFYVMEVPAWAAASIGEATSSWPAELVSNSYKIGFQFGHLVLVVYFWPAPDHVIGIVHDEHMPLRWAGEIQPLLPAGSCVGNTPIDRLNELVMCIVPMPRELRGDIVRRLIDMKRRHC
jgi:hypothetical protein